MKKRICAVFILLAFCTALLSCAETPSVSTSSATVFNSAAVSASNPEKVVLRVCADGRDKGYLESAFRAFTMQYDVEIVCDWLPLPLMPGDAQTGPGDAENRDASLQRLRTEIPAGQGPDVFVLSLENGFDPLFYDMMKTMRNGVFMDLAPMLAKKEGNFAFMNENLLPAGQVDGAQYLLPLSYRVDGILLCDTPAKNKALAAQLEEAALLEHLAILDALELNPSVGIWWKNLTNSNNPPMNYETMQVDLFTPPVPELLRRAAAWQTAQAAQAPKAPLTGEDILNSMACNTAGGDAFQMGSADFLDISATRLMEGTGTLFVPTPNVDGEIYAYLLSVAAIGAGCENVPEAQMLLNFLLAEKFQAVTTKKSTTQTGFPARKGLLPALFQLPPGESSLDGIPYTLLSGETLASFTSVEDKIDGAFLLQKLPAEVTRFSSECMKKSGGQLQNADIEAIQKKLALYLGE